MNNEKITSNELYHGELKIKEYWSYELGEHTQDGKNYIQYRIPGMIVTARGTVIIYGESRTDFNLDGHGNNPDLLQFDLYIRRSTDGGETFGAPIYLARGDEYFKAGYGATINNIVIMCGKDERLHLIFSCNVGRFIRDDLRGGVFYICSDDDGITWSDPRNITDELGRGTEFKELACGPGHGICTKSGRLITAVWTDYSVHVNPYSVRTLYSDDNGVTWKLGEKVSNNRDESNIVELSDGSLMVNSRQFTWVQKLTPYRHISVSKTGIDGWSETRTDTSLIDPACMGSTCAVDIEGLPHAILFVNCDTLCGRRNLTVKCSFDDGKTWSKKLIIDKDSGGYSDIAVDKSGKVYVIYEILAGKRLALATFSFVKYFADAAYTPEFEEKDGVSRATRTYSAEEVTEEMLGAAMSGEGTLASPYVIADANTLALVSAACDSAVLKEKYAAAHYRLVTDIDLSAVKWRGIGDTSGTGFIGVFDGGSHKITGLTLDADAPINGLFKSAGGGAIIRNLTVTCGENRLTANRIGALIGIAKGDLNVENCHVNVDICMTAACEAACLGGMIGRDMGCGDKLIQNCTSGGVLSLDMRGFKCALGGLAGMANAVEPSSSCVFIMCKSTVAVSAKTAREHPAFEYNNYGVGALVGTTGWSNPNTVKFVDCHAGGTVSAVNQSAEHVCAGIAVGYITATMKDSGITYSAKLTVDGEERGELAVFSQNFGYAKATDC